MVLEIYDPWASKRVGQSNMPAEDTNALFALLDAVITAIPYESLHGVADVELERLSRYVAAHGELTPDEAHGAIRHS